MPKFTALVKAVGLKAVREKGVALARTCCSHTLQIVGDDASMQALFGELKPLLEKRVHVTITPEQTSLD